jgi:WxcM-like, C-terminal
MSIKTNIDKCQIIDLGKIHNRAGNITIIEGNKLIPFPIRRVYYLYDVPGGAERGGHAHKKLYQFIVAASGSFDVKLNDGFDNKIFTLNHPNNGLQVVPGIWREIINFSSGSICLVLASELFDEAHYIRDFHHYITYRNDSSSI